MKGIGRTDAPPRPTLKTIADLCGLGVPTVSRALNNSPEIGEDTKRRIREIADEIGYVPDRAGLRLRTGRTHVISLVFLMNRDDHLGRLIPAIATALLSSSFQISISPALTVEDGLAAIRQVVEGRLADAVVFNATLVDDPRVAYLVERGFPFATHGRNSWSDRHPYYDFDNGSFARAAGQLLHSRGRRCLGLFGPSHNRTYGRDTFLEAGNVASELDMTFGELDRFINDPLVEMQASAQRFLSLHPDFDGFVCSSDAAALAVASVLEQSGRIIGRDVDIVAKGTRAFLSMVNPAIIAIEEDVDRAAEFLAAAVLQAIRDPNLPPMQAVEQPDFSKYS